jgi:NlpC/P60 family putative phage cell wall peptidase
MATDSVTAAAIVTAARDWIGTPYQHQASLKGVGCDCLGLLRGVWRELRGAEPEAVPPYARDWSEATGAETLRDALARHLKPADIGHLAPGDVVLFRMAHRSERAPAKHCGIIGYANASLLERDVGMHGGLTLIHARQNRRVSEEAFTAFWQARLAYSFRI